MYFDTHAHYDDERYDQDRYELLEAMFGAGITRIVNPGCDQSSSEAAIALSRRYDFVYCTVGWHPHEASNFNSESPDLIRTWVKEEKKIRAIGEIGLDYHYDFSPREVQKQVFRRQMELAQELALPVVIHDREAHGDCMEMIRQFPEVTGAFHCYSGSAEMAKELLDRGWYLGFNGSITFKNARKALETIAITPEDRILLETDAPYLAPVPHRGERNDSRYLEFVARVIGEIKGKSIKDVAAFTFENALRFFDLPHGTEYSHTAEN